jgi:hypothetical protein
MSALSLLSGVKRKSGLRAVRSVVDPERTLGRRDLTLRNRYAGPEPFERLSSFWAAIGLPRYNWRLV